MSRVMYEQRSPLQYYSFIFRNWTPSLATWGVGAGAGALLFLSVTPLVRRELLSKIPGIKGYYTDNTPASDKPF
ncbi:ubiquinol-cytochrome-c reductase complex subunit-domain-containing protein [Lentinula boryana]|uniref:Ubiquinol-cytochrome-c reductase complex subunit-domain-containing protein n=1 Tax=Lentinula boryana TaxID=40481 RepID=A0ABQ8QS67_9AGAR|nr:ubiquinol-cytochrome-c reductase complex subunit-domain-containing protein [Lentinula boryana]